MTRCLVVKKDDALTTIVDTYTGPLERGLVPIRALAELARRKPYEFTIQDRNTDNLDEGRPDSQVRFYQLYSLDADRSPPVDKCGINPTYYFTKAVDSGRFKGME